MDTDLSFKLVIVDDEGKTTPVPLTRDEYTIGRQEGNVIRLTERNISRRHARLFRAKGHWIIEDQGSYNGVFVNSDRIKERAIINSGETGESMKVHASRPAMPSDCCSISSRSRCSRRSGLSSGSDPFSVLSVMSA